MSFSLFSFILLFVFLCPPPFLSAQWKQTNGPASAGISALLSSGGTIYAGTEIEGVFRSIDDGQSWTAENTGIEKTFVRSLAANTNYLFAGVDADYRGHGGVYRAPLDGAQWVPANAGIESMSIASLYSDGPAIYAGTIGSGVFKSTDNGSSWVQANNGMGDEFVTAITRNNGILFAAGSNNLYRSDDEGGSWYFTDGGQYFNIFSLFAADSNMYAGGFSGIIRSTDFGNTWSDRIDILILNSLTHISGFAQRGPALFAATSIGPGNGVIASTDNGLTWIPLNTGIESVSLNTILVTPASLITGGSAKGILLSPDDGLTWMKSNEGLPAGGSIRRLLAVGDTLFAATGGDGVYRTTDQGTTWEQTSGEPEGVLQNEIVPALAESDGVLLAGTAYERIFRSTDGGSTWLRSSSGIPQDDIILSLAVSGTHFLAGTGTGIYYSTDAGLNWLPSNVPAATVTDIASDAGYAYALVSTGIFTSTGVYRSADDGINWTLVTQSGTTTLVGLAAADQYALTGSFSPGGFRSVDYGLNWLGYSIPDANGVYSLLFHEETVYAGGGILSQGVYESNDHGLVFTPLNAGLESYTSVEALAATGSYLFAGTNDRGTWSYSLTGPSSVPADAGVPDQAFMLEQNYPNPFNSRTFITFHVAHRSRVTLTLVDLLGRAIRTLLDGTFEQGAHTESFDASDLPSGVYLCQLNAGNFTSSIKMLVLK